MQRGPDSLHPYLRFYSHLEFCFVAKKWKQWHLVLRSPETSWFNGLLLDTAASFSPSHSPSHFLRSRLCFSASLILSKRRLSHCRSSSQEINRAASDNLGPFASLSQAAHSICSQLCAMGACFWWNAGANIMFSAHMLLCHRTPHRTDSECMRLLRMNK